MQDLEYFGVSRVSWKFREGGWALWGRLPLRDANGAIYFPLKGSGLSHNVEIREAIARDN